MRCLFIDSASTIRRIAITDGDKIVYSISEENGNDLSSKLLPLIVNGFDALKFTVKDLDLIMVVNGPGSFTGIRVGITIAKTLAWSFNINIISLSLLEVLTSGFSDESVVIPLIDARHGYVYSGIYKDGKSVIPDKHMLLSDLINFSSKYDNRIFTSYDKFIDIPSIVDPQVDILKLIEKHKNDQPINPHLVNPIYLKNTEAEDRLSGLL